MRQYKTSKKNRATYTYYSADGKKLIELIPGENGITEADIAMLHEQDDLEYNAQRREDYHVPVHYDSCIVSDGQVGTDRNPYLADTDSSPEDLIFGALEVSERKAAIRMLWNALLPQQRELVLKKLRGMSNTDIAAAEGITEAAVRNRLKKVQERFKIFK